MKQLETIYKDINSIVPYENNPRLNDSAVDAVAASIKQFGFKQPVVLDKNSVIVVGHTRVKAAKKLGIEKVPCVIADDLTDEEVKAYRLADNKTSELSEWDYGLLFWELNDIDDIDMSELGFVSEDFESVGDEPESFSEISEDKETKNKCPSCGYEW